MARHTDGHAWVMPPPVFVGRGRELAALAEALASPPAVVLVEGEAGIGKSRLLREFLAGPAVPLPGVLVAADCPPLRDPYTLGPVVDAVRQATERVAGLGLSDLAGALRPLFPEWASDLPPSPEPAEDARAARHRLFRALTELLDRLGVTVLVIEDVHWADDATLEFLLFVASRQPQPVSLVLTYRPEDVPEDSLFLRLSSRLSAGTTRQRLTLGPLDVGETASLVSSMLGAEEVSAQFAAFVHQRTDGVPLAVEESVRLMHERADVVRHGSRWVRRNLADIDVPPTVRDAVVERTRRLGGDARAVLEAAAVLAAPAGEEVLVAVSGLSTGRAAAGVAEALGCGLLRDDERGLVSFRHGLVSRAVYETIPGPLRRVMHLRAGRVLEEISPQSAARLARHFREAGETSAWALHGERAAEAAAAAGDAVAAAAVLHQLLSSGQLPATAVAPLAAKIPRGALAGSSRLSDIARALQSALDSGALDRVQAAMARYRLGMELEAMCDYDGSGSAFELAIPDLPPGSSELLLSMIMLGWPRGSTRPGRVHHEWLRRAAKAACSMPPAQQPDITVTTAVALLMLGEPEGWAVADRIPGEVATPAQRRISVHRDVNLGYMAMRWGRFAEARRRLSNALELAEEHVYPRYRKLCQGTLTMLDWFTGDWDGLADRVAELAEAEATPPVSRLEAVLVTGLLLAMKGRAADAESVLSSALARARDMGAVETMVEPAAELAQLYLAAGRVEDALAVTAEPIGVVELKETWLWATALAPARLDALVAAGRMGEAAELVTAFGAGVRGRDAPAPRAAVTLCRGILRAAGGEHGRAAELFDRAAAAWDALPRPYDALLARERRARCLLAAGQREAGVAQLGEVFTRLSDRGAHGAADRVLAALAEHGAAGGRARNRGRPGYGDQLSPREVEVVRLLVEGRSNPQIAEALTVARQTVNSHVRSAMRKLRVSSRTALAVSAVQLGLDRDESSAPADD